MLTLVRQLEVVFLLILGLAASEVYVARFGIQFQKRYRRRDGGKLFEVYVHRRGHEIRVFNALLLLGSHDNRRLLICSGRWRTGFRRGRTVLTCHVYHLIVKRVRTEF